MSIRTILIAASGLLAASCASAAPDYAKTPPAPGPDVYRCVNSDGKPYFVRVAPGLHQTWRGDAWSANSCEDKANTCKTDETGLIVVERTGILPTSKDRMDMIDIFNLKAGTVLSSIALNGMAMTPSRNTCVLQS